MLTNLIIYFRCLGVIYHDGADDGAATIGAFVVQLNQENGTRRAHHKPKQQCSSTEFNIICLSPSEPIPLRSSEIFEQIFPFSTHRRPRTEQKKKQ